MVWAAIAAGLLVSASSASPEPQRTTAVRPWYQVSWLGGRSSAQGVMLLSRVTSDAAPPFWIAEQRGSTDWIDGRTCPALGKAADALADLPARMQGSSENASIDILYDAGVTIVRGPFHLKGGVVLATFQDQLGPLDQWRRATAQALEPCWSKAPLSNDIPAGAKRLDWLALIRD